MHQLDCQQIYFCFRGMILRCDTLVPRFIPAIPGQQCQFKCRTNLGCLRRLFRVTIIEDGDDIEISVRQRYCVTKFGFMDCHDLRDEDGMIELSLSTDDKVTVK
ncbi:Hypothetical_protein [Hexamita inflata]|uniref:Hypothetical_protein n=1 Tax=Hexamita inflata TaxID=28002 RepID=A0AA86PDH8_9EUKA|nr:Hypothetical protein HINF_LOCUS24207 [Hexamita inflata]